MAFTYVSEDVKKFGTFTDLKSYIKLSEQGITQIPLEELMAEDAHFFSDSRFGSSTQHWGFTEYAYKAFCQYFALPISVIEGISQEGLASIVLNDFLKNNKGRQDYKDVYLVVDDQKKLVRGIVTSTYVYYTNMEFIDAVENILDMNDARKQETILDSAYYYNTRLYVRLVTNIEAGVVSGSGGTAIDKTKIGLQLTNSMVGDLPVRVAFFLYRLLCANGLVAPVNEMIAVVKHSGYRDSFDRRLSERVLALLEEVQQVKDLLNGLAGMPYKPQQLVKAGLADSILDIVPEMRSTLRKHVSLEGESDIKGPKERKVWRQIQYLEAIPTVYGREHSLKVFNSKWRDNATMFDFINVLTEYAKELPVLSRLQVEENVGVFADYVVKNTKRLSK